MEYLLKASAVIALFYLCFYFFLKKETFFNHNRWFLLIGVVVALLFPLVVIPIHIAVEPLTIPETTFAFSENMPQSLPTDTPEPKYQWERFVSILYGIGLTVFLIQFIFQFGSLILLLLKNTKNRAGRYTYVIVNSKITPFSFFKWIVYNPESFNETELQLMLTHEKVHVNQMHSLDILFTQLSCAIFWFNPMMWFYRREVKQNLEYIADFETQDPTLSKKPYQRLLLKTCVANHNISLSNNFYNSLIKERIIMLNKSRSSRIHQWRYLLILPLLAGLLMSMNTEEIYVESERRVPSENNAISISPQNEIESQNLEIIFNKNMTDKELDDIKKELLGNNITMTINQLKRNSKGEIKAININFETENGSTNYSVKDNNGIDPFYFNMSDNGSFGVGAQNKKEIIIVESTDNSASKNKGSHRVFNKADGEIIEIVEIAEIVEDSIPNNHIKGYAKLHHKASTAPKYTYRVVGAYPSRNRDSLFINRHLELDTVKFERLAKTKYKLHYKGTADVQDLNSGQYTTRHQPTKSITSFSFYDSQNPKPLIVINGRIAESTLLSTVDPNNIDSLDVLKGESAIEVYGDQGENGVIIIKLKDSKSSKLTKTANEVEKGPWKTSRTEVNNITYIDDEDPSKSAMMAYVTKYTSDKIIDNHKSNLEKYGLKVKISKVKRNKKKEITSIKISISDEKGDKSSASYKDSDGISGIEFGKYEGALVVRTSTMN